MSSINTNFEVLSRLSTKTMKAIGKIESVALNNNRVYAVVRRVEELDPEENLKLFNDQFATSEDELSFFEIAIPITNIDLSKEAYNSVGLIRKYVEVTMRDDGKALYAEYIGDFPYKKDEMLEINRDFFFNARLRLLEKNSEMTEDNMISELIDLGLDRETALSLFSVKVQEVFDKVVMWTGESYYHKDIGTPTDREVYFEPPEFLKSLNKKPMKIKACHKFNKVFTGR